MKPASRVGDLHVCPMVTPGVPPVPHVGGPLLPAGAPTVLIGGMPGSRVSDMATCVGPPDAVASGAFTVLVEKLPAARLSDQTVHGGMITVGIPTVLIGDPGPGITVVRRGNIFIIVDRNNHRIYIVGVQEYSGTGASQAFVDRAINTINNTWSGPTTFEGQPYTVDSMITGRLRESGDAANPMANQIDVVQSSQTPAWHGQNDPAIQPYYGNGTGHQYSTMDTGGEVVAAHEFGHSMGLNDEYHEGPRNPDGTRSIVRTGPAGGLMGYIDPGSRPTPDNFNSLITGNGLH